MKVWKRCIAVLLSFTILYTSTEISHAAGTFYEKFHSWTASRAEILAEFYELSDKEFAVLTNDAINQGYTYAMSYPYQNVENSKKNLVEVDYLNKLVYAKAYASGGYIWEPVTATINADGIAQEEVILTEGTYYFNEKEYNASGAFTYNGNSYTATITYELRVDIALEEQNRILRIPAVLAQTATNASNLNSMRFNVKKLGEMSPFLYELLTLEFEVQTKNIVEKEDEEGNLIKEEETVVTMQPALDPIEDAEVIAAIDGIYKEYSENNGMILSVLAEEYNKEAKNVLTFTFANGEQVKNKSSELFEYVNILKSSTRLKNVINKLSTVDETLYQNTQYLSSITTALLGTVRKPGPLRELRNETNWEILDEAVKSSILKNGYSTEELLALEPSVYALRSTTIEVPNVTSEIILAATTTVSCDITIYDVNISVSGKVVSENVGEKTLTDLESAEITLKLLAGTPVEDVEKAIKACGIEENTLQKWNSKNSEYQVNASNYVRKSTEVTKALNKDIEYKISYAPKYFKVKTNFAGNEELPYGYRLHLPLSTDEELCYDYEVMTEEGVKVTYNDGGIDYKITKSVTITQLEGAQKTEYRLYNVIVDDVQYSISDDAKKILGNSAINSPMLKIRVPDGRTVGEITEENGIFSVTAKTVDAGAGMTWEPHIAYVINGETLIKEVPFEDGVATWDFDGFTHVKVDYRLKIEKVKDGLTNRELDEIEDVLYALNLPYDLVTDVITQHRLLSGDSGITVKNMYQKMDSLKLFMSQEMLTAISENYLQTKAAKEAVLVLMTGEKQMAVNSSGKKLGYGAWNFATNELAIYTYMGYCAQAEWSLAHYYKEEYYEPLGKQCSTVADCLEKIASDPGFVQLLKDFGQGEEKRDQILTMVPQLKQLSQQLKGPHKALNVNDPGFAALIEELISMEGKVEAVDTSNGIYAYTSFQRNGDKTGSMTVSVQAGSAFAKKKEIPYPMETAEHILTDEDVQKIQSCIAELEGDLGLTEEEKQYYDLIATDIPGVGDVVGKYATVSLVYSPKEYVVTVAGIEDYKATFKYKSDYVIELPAYSEKTDEISYYCYLIKGEKKKVYNGTVGYYTFTKEDLTELFVNQHHEIEVEILKNISEWDIVPEVDLLEASAAGVIKGHYLDFDNKLLFLDAQPTGMTIAQFQKYVNFKTGGGMDVSWAIYNENKDLENYLLLGNGSIVECSLQDKKDEPPTAYTIILMGDVDKNGVVDENDMKLLKKNYLGVASQEEKIGDSASILAADMNGNGIFDDSNDAWYIVMKYLYWANSSGKTYTSVL